MSAPVIPERKSKLTPYQRIIRAQHMGHGIRLTHAECDELGQDQAIVDRAERDDMGIE